MHNPEVLENLDQIEYFLVSSLRYIDSALDAPHENALDYESLGNIRNDLQVVLDKVRAQLSIRYE